MENFDVLNSDGEPTGVVKPRVEVHRDGDWHRSVHVWIINSKQELLLQKRAHNKDSFPNMWDISVAGHVSAGQKSLETGIREVRAEVGLDITNDELEHNFTVKNQNITDEGKFVDNEFNDVYLIRKDVEVPNLNFDKKEIAELQWMHFEKLEGLVKQTEDNQIVPHEREYQLLFDVLREKSLINR